MSTTESASRPTFAVPAIPGLAYIAAILLAALFILAGTYGARAAGDYGEGGLGKGSEQTDLRTSGPWAAIAADGNGRWGHAVSQPAQDAAENAALAGCGDDCKIIGDRALEARCIAYAESRQGGYWYFGWLGPNESTVQDKVLNACN